MEVAAIIVIIAGTILNLIPFILGSIHTPDGLVFFGTVHHPLDYSYYLSQISQGVHGSWFFSQNLFTSEPLAPSLIGWVNVFVGHIIGIVVHNPIVAYQIALGAATAAYLFGAYKLIQTVFHRKDEQQHRLITLLFFITSNAFPILSDTKTGYQLSGYSFWSNIGEPWTRIGGVPHHLFGQAALMLIFWLGLHFSKHPRLYAGALIILGLILGTVQPMQWMLSVIILGGTQVLWIFWQYGQSWWKQRGKKLVEGQTTETIQLTPPVIIQKIVKQMVREIRPAFFVGIGGLPIVLYLQKAFTQAPYVQLAAWERAQQLHPTFITFLKASGPMMCLGLFGIVIFFLKPSKERLLINAYLVITIAIFLSFLPMRAGYSDIRFLSGVTILCAVINTTSLLQAIAKRTGRFRTIAFGIPVGILFLFVVPLTIIQFVARTQFSTQNSYHYLPKQIIDAYAAAEKVGKAEDVFLIGWPFELGFPAITGLREYLGHPLITIDAEKKNANAYHFFDHRLSETEAKAFFQDNHITYLMVFPLVVTPLPAYLTEIYRNDMIALYKVLR